MREDEFTQPWEIPLTWAWQRIGDVCDVIGGATPDTRNPDNFDGGNIPWVTPADLSGYREKFIAQGGRNITRAGLDSSSARLLPQGTVLFSSRAPVGYVAIAAAPLATNQGFKSFVPPSGIASDYLYYYLQRAKSLALELASGTTFQEVSGKRAAQIPLAIAPEHEQTRIVAKLEELFSDLDAGVAALERARTNLKRYRAAVLKAAVEGKLTEQWRKKHPDIEPARKLLERILAERRKKWEEAQLAKYTAAGKTPPNGWKGKYPEAALPDANALPEVPEGWCWATLEQLVVQSEYGTSVKCGYDGEYAPVLRIPNVVNGRIDLADLKFSLTKLDLETGDELLPGDLLMCRTNGSISLIGKSAVVREQLDRPYAFASYLLRFRFVHTADIPFWIDLSVTSQKGRAFIESKAASSAGQHNISLSTLHGMPIPLPPLAEQKQIATLVDERFSVIEKASDEIEQQLLRASRLRQGILKRAFKGKLVPQDPNDEPASVLLERIRAARTALAPPARNGRGKRIRTA